MFRVWLCAGILLATAGCGKTNEFGPTGTVAGKLTYEGKPLQTGSMAIFMHPSKGYLVFGLTAADGAFNVDSWNSGQLPIGVYKVMVQPPNAGEGANSGDLEALMNNPKANAPAKIDFPLKYRTTETSGLEFEVVEGANSFEIELKGAVVAPKK